MVQCIVRLKSLPVGPVASSVFCSLNEEMYCKTQPGAWKANGCIPPSLSPLSLSPPSVSCFVFITFLSFPLVAACHVFHPVRGFSALKTYFPFCLGRLRLQLHGVSALTSPSSSAPVCAVAQPLIHRINVFILAIAAHPDASQLITVCH